MVMKIWQNIDLILLWIGNHTREITVTDYSNLLKLHSRVQC